MASARSKTARRYGCATDPDHSHPVAEAEQGPEVRAMFQESLPDVEVPPDLAGRDRVLRGRVTRGRVTQDEK